MHPLLNIATRAARAAGNTIMRALPRVNVIKKFEKGTNDFVTEIDHAVEREIIRLIHSFYPQHGILGEESGRLEGQDKAQDYLWIIDPIDGTTNFMHGVPHFAISIAIQYQGRIEHGGYEME